jgi:hypothetical protein
MNVKFARGFAFSVLLLDLLLLTWSLLLHVEALIGNGKPYALLNERLFAGSIAAVFLSVAFVKDNIRWTTEIKRCPTWMWRSALGLALYQFLVLGLKFFVFPDGTPAGEQLLVWSAWPIGFDAISFCIVYSALWSGAVSDSELVRRARNSGILAIVIVVVIVANRAGYLAHIHDYFAPETTQSSAE